jgi:hypothetical protein
MAPTLLLGAGSKVKGELPGNALTGCGMVYAQRTAAANGVV